MIVAWGRTFNSFLLFKRLNKQTEAIQPTKFKIKMHKMRINSHFQPDYLSSLIDGKNLIISKLIS